MITTIFPPRFHLRKMTSKMKLSYITDSLHFELKNCKNSAQNTRINNDIIILIMQSTILELFECKNSYAN